MALTDNLVGYWKVDSNSNDSVGIANGTDTSMSYSTPGKINNASQFNGSSSTFTVPVVLGTSGSVNMWIKRSDTTTAYSVAFGSTKIGVSDYIRITPRENNNGVQWIMKDEVQTSSWTTDTNYHMYTLVWDSSTAWQGYQDGTLVQTGSAVRNPTNTGYNLRFGITPDGTSIYTPGQTYFSGSIDEIGYWNRRITSTEITQLYSGGSGLSYPFTTTSNTSFLLGYTNQQ